MNANELVGRLAAPFSADEVKFKPGVISGNRALALVYVDARVIQDRLDEVLGAAGWQDEYECLPDGSVVCRLRLRIGDEWITKMDVGSPSEQPDEGDRRKAAFSDALKRAAVKFGIGRYLYRMPSQWVDYDPHKKRFTAQPKLPAVARPARKAQPAAGLRRIDGGQAQVLLALINQTGTDPARFCEAYRIDTPEHLPAEHFADAEAKLRRKLGSRAGKPAPAGAGAPDQGAGPPPAEGKKRKKALVPEPEWADEAQDRRINELLTDLEIGSEAHDAMLEQFAGGLLQGQNGRLTRRQAAELLTHLEDLDRQRRGEPVEA